MTKMLLADHQCLFRAGMVRLIVSIGGFGVSGEVDSAEAAVEFVAQHRPDILLLDCLLYTSPSPRDRQKSRMPSSA